MWRLYYLPLSPLTAAAHALLHCYEEDSFRDLPENFFVPYWRVMRVIWTRGTFWKTAGYYRLFDATGSCGPWVFKIKKPRGKLWKRGKGF